MQYRTMADGNLITDMDWKSLAGMNNGIILDVRRFPDINIIFVSPDDGTEPDAHVFLNCNGTEDRGIWCNKPGSTGAFIHTHNNIAV